MRLYRWVSSTFLKIYLRIQIIYSDFISYRLAVLRALPHLQKLDDVAVTPEELSDANKRGQLLNHPEDEEQNHGDYYNKSSQPPTRRSTPEISPTRIEVSLD